MAKQLTLVQFEQTVGGLLLNSHTVEIAKSVLVEGRQQIELACLNWLYKRCYFSSREAGIVGV